MNLTREEARQRSKGLTALADRTRAESEAKLASKLNPQQQGVLAGLILASTRHASNDGWVGTTSVVAELQGELLPRAVSNSLSALSRKGLVEGRSVATAEIGSLWRPAEVLRDPEPTPNPEVVLWPVLPSHQDPNRDGLDE